MYVNQSEVVALLDDVYGLANAGVCDIGEQDHLSRFPGYRFGDTVDGISCILYDKHVSGGAVNAIGDERSHIIDIHFRLSSKPFFSIALALLFQVPLILHDRFGGVPIAAMVDIDIIGI